MDWSELISAFIGAALGSLGTTLLTLRQSKADRLADAYAALAGATTALIQSAPEAVFQHAEHPEQWIAFGRCLARCLLQEKRQQLRDQLRVLRTALDDLHSTDVPVGDKDPDPEEFRTLQAKNLLDRHNKADNALELLLILSSK